MKCEYCFIEDAIKGMSYCKTCIEAFNEDANREMGIPESLLDEDWGGK